MNDTTKVRRLAPARREPDAEIITMLESALERARKGEFADCVVICGGREGYDHDYKINSDGFGIAGYMLRVQHEIVTDQED